MVKFFNVLKGLSAGLCLTVLAACGGGGGGTTTPVPPAAPVISSAPVATVVTAGSSATFSVTATGTDLSYQWQRGGTAISGATGSSYTLPAPTLADNNVQFRVVVTNPGGSVTSAPAVLSVVPLVITTQPAAVTVSDGTSAQFSVAASGPGTLSYQWQRNSLDITGATAASYTSPALSLADSGASFRVIVSNTLGQVNSANAIVTVQAAPPTITTSPASVNLPDGGTTTFSVAVRGTAPFTYQWQRDNANIAGATDSSYTTPNIIKVDSGVSFRVIVSNALGQATSATAVVTVVDSAPAIAQAPESVSVVAGTVASFTVFATGTKPLSYQWQRNGVDISGATASSYAISTTLGDNNTAFRAVVTNALGSVTSDAATLSVASAPIAPSIVTDLLDVTAREGDRFATFRLTLLGTGPFTFEWIRRDAISTRIVLTFSQSTLNHSFNAVRPTVAADNNAFFSLRITNAAGSVTSREGKLTVCAALAPSCP